MRLLPTQILMMEAYLDGELAGDEISKIQDLMDTNPELQQLYNILKSQKDAIKLSFTRNNRIH